MAERDRWAVCRLMAWTARLAVVAVPVVGWFVGTWSGATTLVVYWFETVVTCLLVAARIRVHQRWNPRHGHHRYEAPAGDRGAVRGASFFGGFTRLTLVLCAAHALFLGALLMLLRRMDVAGFAAVSWRSVGLGCVVVFAFLVVGFAADLPDLSRWRFWQMERVANRSLSRVVVVHLAVLLGFAGVAFTDSPNGFFSAFVAIKTLSAVSWSAPRAEPSAPPRWLSRVMNRLFVDESQARFEQLWARDRSRERQRHERNERPWP